jgi:hypothetical protein
MLQVLFNYKESRGPLTNTILWYSCVINSSVVLYCILGNIYSSFSPYDNDVIAENGNYTGYYVDRIISGAIF